MAQKHGKSGRPLSELVAEIERSRIELSLGLRQVGEGFDIPARFSRSIARQPANWAAGFLIAGLVAIGVSTAGSCFLSRIRLVRPRLPATSAGDEKGSGPPSFQAAGAVSKGFTGRGAFRRKSVADRAVRWAAGIVRRAVFRAALGFLARRVFGEAISSLQKGGAGGLSLGRNPAEIVKELARCLTGYLARRGRRR